MHIIDTHTQHSQYNFLWSSPLYGISSTTNKPRHSNHRPALHYYNSHHKVPVLSVALPRPLHRRKFRLLLRAIPVSITSFLPSLQRRRRLIPTAVIATVQTLHPWQILHASSRLRATAARAARRRVARAPRRATVGRRWYEALLHSLLLLHPSILEPDLHLGLVKLEGRGYLDAARARQVLVEVELLLELGQLLVREVRAAGVVEASRHSRGRCCDAEGDATGERGTGAVAVETAAAGGQGARVDGTHGAGG